MSICIKKGFGFVADSKFLELCDHAIENWCFNTDGKNEYFVGIILDSNYSKIMPIGGENMKKIQKEYDQFVKDSIEEITDPEGWPDEKSRNAWIKTLQNKKPKLVVFV